MHKWWHGSINRETLVYIILSTITIILGLLSRSSFSEFLPKVVSLYAGDTLWATVVFFWLCIIRPSWPVWNVALVAVLISFCVEFSQIYHASWIDCIRSTTVGGLVLGFGFKFSDLVCYIVGVFLGIAVNLIITSKLGLQKN